MGFRFPDAYQDLPSPQREEKFWDDFLDFMTSEHRPFSGILEWNGVEIDYIESFYYIIKFPSPEDNFRYFCRFYPGLNFFNYLRDGYRHRREGPAGVKLWNRDDPDYSWYLGGMEFTFSEFLRRVDSSEKRKELICRYA
jgi:hypothetical protein